MIYRLILPLIFFLPSFVFTLEIGPQLGVGYESWEKNSAPYYEKAFFNLGTGFITHHAATKRVHFFIQGGAHFAGKSSSAQSEAISAYYNLYVGATAGWIIHPEYSPFIGATVQYRFYPEVLDTKNKSLFTLNFTGGTKVMKIGTSACWMLLDIGLFNSEYNNYYLSYFKLSLAYLFDL